MSKYKKASDAVAGFKQILEDIDRQQPKDPTLLESPRIPPPPKEDEEEGGPSTLEKLVASAKHDHDMGLKTHADAPSKATMAAAMLHARSKPDIQAAHDHVARAERHDQLAVQNAEKPSGLAHIAMSAAHHQLGMEALERDNVSDEPLSEVENHQFDFLMEELRELSYFHPEALEALNVMQKIKDGMGVVHRAVSKKAKAAHHVKTLLKKREGQGTKLSQMAALGKLHASNPAIVRHALGGSKNLVATLREKARQEKEAGSPVSRTASHYSAARKGPPPVPKKKATNEDLNPSYLSGFMRLAGLYGYEQMPYDPGRVGSNRYTFQAAAEKPLMETVDFEDEDVD